MCGSLYLAERERAPSRDAESLAALTLERPVLGTDPMDAATDGAITLPLLGIGTSQ